MHGLILSLNYNNTILTETVCFNFQGQQLPESIAIMINLAGIHGFKLNT